MSDQKEIRYCNLCGCYIPIGYTVCPACGKVVGEVRVAPEEKKECKEEPEDWFLDIDKLRFKLGRIKINGKIYSDAGCCGIIDEVNRSETYTGKTYDGGISRGQIVKYHKMTIKILWEEV